MDIIMGRRKINKEKDFREKAMQFKLTRGGLIKDDDLRRRHQPHPSP